MLEDKSTNGTRDVQEEKNIKIQKSDILLFIVSILIITNVVSVYFLFNRKSNIGAIQENPESHEAANDALIDQSATTTGDEIEDVEKASSDDIKSTKIVDEKSEEISVKWNEWPVKTYSSFDFLEVEKLLKKHETSFTSADAFIQSFNFYSVGTVLDGAYKGKELMIITYKPEGPSFRDEMFRVIKNEDELIVLTRYSDELWGIYDDVFSKNDSIEISDFEPLKEIKIPNSDIKLIRSEVEPMRLISEYNGEFIFEYEGQKIYKSINDGCFFSGAKDGTAREYYFELNFVRAKETDTLSTPRSLDVVWSDGTNNEYDFESKRLGGCGLTGCYAYADYISDKNQLVEAGKSQMGEIIYELKDKNMKVSPNYENGVLRGLYDLTHDDQGKNYDSFVNDHPLVYWKDPFGKFIEFRNSKYQPMVECGKPVIYLYPEREMDASVYVTPTGGFTVTEPAYNNGWKVKAKPNGELYNYADKTTYPYLFWEGYGMDYVRPDKGFVVKREEMAEFLVEKLTKLGLIKKEYDEFIEFWLPKMQDKSYYFVTFMDQAEFDKVAPLTVVPTPDKVIRIFMDYEGLDKYIEVEEQEIVTPVRKGFTVVEWGGALHH